MSDIEAQLARMIPDPMVQQWRLLRPFMPPLLRQWVEAAARAMLASRLPYPQRIQQLDRLIGQRSALSSSAAPRAADAAVLRHCVMLQIRAETEAAAHAVTQPMSPAPAPCCPMPEPFRFGPEFQRYVRGANGRVLAQLPLGKCKAWLPANFHPIVR